MDRKVHLYFIKCTKGILHSGCGIERDLLPPLEGEEPRWASLYATLVPRPSRDISWQLLHGAVSTGMYLARFTPVPDTCSFCGVRETLAHVYLECARLQPLFQLLTNILLRFWLHFSPHLLLYALRIRGPTKSRGLLVNLLLAWLKRPSIKPGRGGWQMETPVTVGPVSDPLSVHVSGQSSSGQHPLAPLMPLRSSGHCPGFSARCPLFLEGSLLLTL
ncbi:unnamed protein product [Eretmochelys imbricata]